MKQTYTLSDIKLRKIDAIYRIGEGIPFEPKGSIDYKVDLKAGSINERPTEGAVSFAVSVTPRTGQKPFEIYIEVIALYKSNDGVVDVKNLGDYARTIGHTEVWIYIRNELENIVRSLGLPIKINLPMVSPLVFTPKDEG